jgi:hypothetical protein
MAAFVATMHPGVGGGSVVRRDDERFVPVEVTVVWYPSNSL